MRANIVEPVPPHRRVAARTAKTNPATSRYGVASQSRQKPLAAQRKRRGFLMRPTLIFIEDHELGSAAPRIPREEFHSPARANAHFPAIARPIGRIGNGLAALE